ncbi:hypothetical protein F5876DRAFT_80379 [Lentinula aff. lateritia]|uniref:Uncharacterized protein n=1 Tax=Lentinula aff. lateritia TaxID=2804960 RepID=A0ACC1TQ97_9AGAR|nr:hypothetical protein F5876DRAFT_80379 [Lentinula aff. lateritia]
MAIAALACGCVTTGFLFNVPTRLNLDSPWVKVTRTPISPVRALFDMVKSPIFAQNILRACTALISSGAICWGYRSTQAMTRRTESVLQRILQFAVTRGILLVAAQIVAAIMFEVEPETLRWMIFHMMLDKIYVITMMTMLNSRGSFRETLALPVTDSDFLRRSSSNKRMRNVAMPLQSPLDVIHHPNRAQAQPSTMESAPELEIDIDLDSLQSGKLSGILVSREMITAIDYGSPQPKSPTV